MFSEVNGRMRFLRWLDPLSVQICPRKIAAVVANNHSIDVEHWHYFEHKILSQTTSYCTIAKKEVDNIFNDVACHSLTGMHASR